MAAIISFLSKYNPKSTLKNYTLPNGKDTLEGTFTNEVPIEYLVREAKAEKASGEKIKLICIVSKDVYEDKHVIEIKEKKDVEAKHTYTVSQYEYYCRWFKELMKKHNVVDFEIKMVPYDFVINECGDRKIVALQTDREIANNLYSNISEETINEKKVYIDYTGGLRDTTYLIATLIQYFKIVGVKCRCIAYSELPSDEETGKLKRIKYIYKINEITGGADEFVSTGNITRLKKFFEQEKTKNESVLEIINSIDKFTKAISISQTDKLDIYKKEVEASIAKYDKSKGSSDLYTNIFSLMFRQIQESLHIGTDKEWSYNEIVKWCVDHGYLQQAFTIYVEKIPAIYLDKGVREKLPPTKSDDHSKKHNGKSTEQTQFYNDFWNNFCGIGKGSEEFAPKMVQEFKSPDGKYFLQQKFISYDIEESAVFTDKEKRLLDLLRKRLTEHDSDKAFKDFGFYISKEKLFSLYKTVFYGDCKKLAEGLLGIPSLYMFSGKLAAANGLDDKYATLKSVMRIFLAVKIMRNHMSHAIGEDDLKGEDNSRKDDIEAEKNVIEQIFEKEGIKKDDDVFGYENAYNLIKKGIEITGKIVAESALLFPEN